jgi:transposase-like protein
MTRQRRHFPVPQKVAILRLHFLEKIPVSDVCEKHGIPVTLFYNWQKQLFDNAEAAFTVSDKRRRNDADAKDQQIAALEDKLQRKHEVLSEVMEEFVRLKKTHGEL